MDTWADAVGRPKYRAVGDLTTFAMSARSSSKAHRGRAKENGDSKNRMETKKAPLSGFFRSAKKNPLADDKPKPTAKPALVVKAAVEPENAAEVEVPTTSPPPTKSKSKSASRKQLKQTQLSFPTVSKDAALSATRKDAASAKQARPSSHARQINRNAHAQKKSNRDVEVATTAAAAVSAEPFGAVCLCDCLVSICHLLLG